MITLEQSVLILKIDLALNVQLSKIILPRFNAKYFASDSFRSLFLQNSHYTNHSRRFVGIGEIS